ncbi:MAG: HAMP domain-containing histidine kinase [Gammaproteobacteria bacterium]|nr:HAMP domain-containing histidine kinase [Gammaproteobacteria bacterium]
MTSLNSEPVHDSFDVFNHQTGLLEESFRDLQQRNERLTSIGEMTAEFAHQVRTPLSSALLYAGQLDTSTPRQARIAARIICGLGELRSMVDDMLGFAAGSRSDHQRITVLKLLHDVRDGIAGQLSGASRVRVSVTDPQLAVLGNKIALKGSLLNLVSNADQASEAGASILLHAHQFGDSIHVCVTDDGPGIADDVQPRLFDAFFTTRKHGTGLGLAVVKAVAAAHGGDVTVATSKLGSTFSVCLPEADASGERR